MSAGTDMVTVTVAVAVCVGVAVAGVPALRMLRMRQRIRRRMRGLDLFGAVQEGDDAVAVPVREEAGHQHPLAVLLDSRYPLSGGVRTGLAVLAGAALAMLAGFWVLLFFGMPLLFSVLGAAAIGAIVGWTVGSTREGGQRIRYADRMLAAIDELQRMVRAGMPVAEAFRATAASADEPVAESWRRVGHVTEMGVPLATALDHEARRLRISDLAMLAAIFATQSRVGGGIAESVGNLADMLRERKDNRARKKSATAESKLSLIVLAVVPFAAVGIQGVSKPEIFGLLLGDARHLLGIGLGLVLLGLACAWLLVRGVR